VTVEFPKEISIDFWKSPQRLAGKEYAGVVPLLLKSR
jgi:hypothetical protein